MRLIDADALLQGLCDGDPSRMEDFYYNAIKDAPTVDIKTEVAREIFAEIEKYIQAELKTLSIFDEDEDDFYTGERFGLKEIGKKLAELKNKYTKEGVGE